MGNDSLKISVSEKEFKSKSVEDQLWIVFQAVNFIDQRGCKWAQGRWKKMYGIGAAAGLAGGFGAMLAKLAFWR